CATSGPASTLEAPTLPLLPGKITLAEALDAENILSRLAYPSQRFEFFLWIFQHRKDFEAIPLTRSVGLAKSKSGDMAVLTFVLGVPIYIDNWSKSPRTRVLLRIPLPYKVGESEYPGNADEKLRTEAATFIWIEDNCPAIPIPHLWGFGFPAFMKPENAPFMTRMIWYLQHAVISFLGSPLAC
ncbi:hypothetical protein LARI1_G005886, partial [Lachnellula arida]